MNATTMTRAAALLPAPIPAHARQPRQEAPRPGTAPRPTRIRLSIATDADREAIYRIRHDVYARELGQHPTGPAGRLTDPLDAHNLYVVARAGDEIVGFVSITPPGSPSYSIDKYLARERLPFAFDDRLHEVRLLTVRDGSRGGPVAMLLMYAALRWVESHGGTRIVAIGRREVVPLYLRSGLIPAGPSVRCGAVTFDVLHAEVSALRARAGALAPLFRRLGSSIAWELAVPFAKPAPCFHGGAFFRHIGERFDSLEKRHSIVNADVLDAWFPPSPRVVDALRAHLEWIVRTSPPTSCQGLVEAIAEARGVAPDTILPGAGSSDLIYLALRHWLKPASRVLVLDPTYGEYAHVLERVVGCTVDRLVLDRNNQYAIRPGGLAARLAGGHDLVVLVNPNSPTGQCLDAATLRGILRSVPARTRVWIDETYIDYVGREASLERFAVGTENVVVCKSMSKVYALSGARSAYLCAGPHQLEELRSITPPWAVGLPGQIAAVMALGDPAYYSTRYAETHVLREGLAAGLAGLGLDVVPGCANFLLAHLPADGPGATDVVAECRRLGLFIRDAGGMGQRLGQHAVRVAVKDAATNRVIVAILAEAIAHCRSGSAAPRTH